MKTLSVYILCLIVLLVFYLTRVRIVEGYLYFDDPEGGYALFLFILSIILMVVAWVNTPWAEYGPVERPRNKLIIDFVLITALSILLLSGWTIEYLYNRYPTASFLLMGVGCICLPILYIGLVIDDFRHFGYRGLTASNILLGLIFALATALILKSLHCFTGPQDFQPCPLPFIGWTSGITLSAMPFWLLYFIRGSGFQEFLWRCQQTLVQDVFGHRLIGVFVFVAIFTILLWGFYEPLDPTITMNRFLVRLFSNILIGALPSALVFYKTNSIVPAFVIHVMGNIFVWLPTF